MEARNFEGVGYSVCILLFSTSWMNMPTTAYRQNRLRTGFAKPDPKWTYLQVHQSQRCFWSEETHTRGKNKTISCYGAFWLLVVQIGRKTSDGARLCGRPKGVVALRFENAFRQSICMILLDSLVFWVAVIMIVRCMTWSVYKLFIIFHFWINHLCLEHWFCKPLGYAKLFFSLSEEKRKLCLEHTHTHTHIN